MKTLKIKLNYELKWPIFLVIKITESNVIVMLARKARWPYENKRTLVFIES